VSSLQLFQKILDEQSHLIRCDATKDLIQLITFILRKFFKRVTEDPFVIIQAFGPKSRGHWKELSSYKSDSDSDSSVRGVGGVVDLDFIKRRALTWSQQMGVVIAMLVRDGKTGMIQWVAGVLEIVLAERQEIVLSTDGPPNLLLDKDNSDSDDDNHVRSFGGPSIEAMEKFQPGGECR
jgi:replication fork protection complex subunit Tof1/Swi1